jgi:hypothetical protein
MNKNSNNLYINERGISLNTGVILVSLLSLFRVTNRRLNLSLYINVLHNFKINIFIVITLKIWKKFRTCLYIYICIFSLVFFSKLLRGGKSYNLGGELFF